MPVRCVKPLMEANDLFSAETSSDEPTLPLRKSDKEISWSSVELFLSNFFLSLSRARLVVLGDNNGDESGWDSYANFRLKVVLEHDQSNLMVISTKAVCVVPRAGVLVEEELDISDMGLGGEDSLSTLLMSITPFGLPLSAELICGNEAVECVNTLDISSWVKNKHPGFSKLVGLPLSRHEKLCIALLQRLRGRQRLPKC